MMTDKYHGEKGGVNQPYHPPLIKPLQHATVLEIKSKFSTLMSQALSHPAPSPLCPHTHHTTPCSLPKHYFCPWTDQVLSQVFLLGCLFLEHSGLCSTVTSFGHSLHNLLHYPVLFSSQTLSLKLSYSFINIIVVYFPLLSIHHPRPMQCNGGFPRAERPVWLGPCSAPSACNTAWRPAHSRNAWSMNFLWGREERFTKEKL